jgi:hypothetical protein
MFDSKNLQNLPAGAYWTSNQVDELTAWSFEKNGYSDGEMIVQKGAKTVLAIRAF